MIVHPHTLVKPTIIIRIREHGHNIKLSLDKLYVISKYILETKYTFNWNNCQI